jgi:hypothetical protein
MDDKTDAEKLAEALDNGGKVVGIDVVGVTGNQLDILVSVEMPRKITIFINANTKAVLH